MAKNTPTPRETVKISTMFGTPETCSARICRSGSEMVTRIPMIKLISAISQIFFDFERVEPIFAPKGCIDISAPMVNTARPTTRHSVPNKNKKKVEGVRGATVIPSNSTMAAMGRIENKDSCSLFLITVSNGMFLS